MNFSPLADIGKTLGGAISGYRADSRERDAFGQRVDMEFPQQGQPQPQQSGYTPLSSLPNIQPGRPAPMAGDVQSPRVQQAFSGVSDQAFAGNSQAQGRFNGSQQQFVEMMMPLAQEASRRTGVDPRVIVAQAALESGWGRSAPGNNYFGIKSHGQGGGNQLATTEVVNGKPVQITDSFRAYNDPADSVNGYAEFITKNPRYQGMRNAQGLDAQIAELQASGYATDPQYGQKIASIARQLPGGGDLSSAMPASSVRTADASGAIAGAPSITREQIMRLGQTGPEGRRMALEMMKDRRGGGAEFKVVGDTLLKIGRDGSVTPVFGGGQGKAPTVTEFYDEQTGQPYKAQWNPQTGTFERVGGNKAPSGMSIKTNPDGTVEVVQGGAGGGKLTEGQGKDIGYYTRGVDADRQLSTLDTQLTDLPQQAAGSLPLGVGNYLRNPAFRQAKQAADSFLTAVLRKDTGAAVTKQEFELYAPMFLPIPGDDPGTIQQKRRARHVAMLAIRSGLGTAEAVAEANREALGIQEQPVPPGAEGAPQQQGQPVQVQSPQQYQSLQPGTRYVAPDGSVRTKR